MEKPDGHTSPSGRQAAFSLFLPGPVGCLSVLAQLQECLLSKGEPGSSLLTLGADLQTASHPEPLLGVKGAARP